MIGTIICGALLFGASELLGEVYHDNHKDDEKNILIAGGKKLADGFEVAGAKTANVKKNCEVSAEFNKATKVKNINVQNPQEAIDAVMNAVNAKIQRINDKALDEMILVEKQAFESMINVCEVIEKNNKIGEEKLAELADLKAKIVKASADVESQKQSIAQGKNNMKNLFAKLKGFIELNNVQKLNDSEVEVVDGPKTAFTITKESDKKIPDFTKSVEPLKTVSDIKEAAQQQLDK